MSQNTQFLLVKNHKVPRNESRSTPNAFAVFQLHDALINRVALFALFAAILAWGVPATAQSMTGYPLVGVHATQACKSCHTTTPYKSAPTTCGSCHQAIYQQTVNPPHATSGFPTTCDTCHRNTDSTWLLATFSHTTFPLAGVHTTQACTTCHVNNVYKGTQTTCVGCHLNKYAKNYNNSVNPPHLAAGFPTTCDTCHKFSAAAWSPASFNHSTATSFPLVGLHATQACTVCHKNNVYKGTLRSCYACHQTLYTATKTPNHLGAGFPTTCDSCHKATDPTWLQGVFNHSYFPITSGNHKRPCADCHKNASAYTVFTCTDCHTQSTTNSKHNGKAGYVWNSVNCYACHPNGKGD